LPIDIKLETPQQRRFSGSSDALDVAHSLLTVVNGCQSGRLFVCPSEEVIFDLIRT